MAVLLDFIIITEKIAANSLFAEVFNASSALKHLESPDKGEITHCCETKPAVPTGVDHPEICLLLSVAALMQQINK